MTTTPNDIEIEKQRLQEKEDRQLLYKYLAKFYGAETAKKLMLKHAKNLFGKNGLSYALGKKSIPYFCLHYLQDVFRVKPDNDARELGDFHYQLWDTLESMIIKDEFDRLVLVLPRGHAKSTVITFALTIWLHCYQVSFYSIVQGKTESDAQKFLADVRAALENNDYIKDSFGELVNSRKHTVNKNELTLVNSTKIEALSSTSSMRGRKHLGKRPSVIINDDIQGLDDVISDQAKQKKLETYQKDVLYAGDTPVYRDGVKTRAGTKFIMIGTTLASDCLISKLLRDKSYRHILKRGIPKENFDTDDYFNNNPYWAEFKRIYFDSKNQYAQSDAISYYEENKDSMQFPVLWPSKWNCLSLAMEYYGNPLAFKSEIQNDTLNIGEKCFFNIKTLPKEEIEAEDFINTMMVVDCAVSTGKRNDYTSICIGSTLDTGHRYIRKGLLLKVEFDDYIAKVIELLKEYTDISHIAIEKNTYQGVDVTRLKEKISADKELQGRNIVFINEYQKRNKENKIRAISGKINNGFIVFSQEDTDFTDQILDYQGEGIGFDDAIDTVSELDIRIDDIETVQPIKFFNVRF